MVADGPVRIQIFDEKKQKVQAEILRTERVDVEQLYEETEIQDKTGFFAELTNLTGKLLYMVFYAGDKKSVHIVHLQPAVVFRKKLEKYAKKEYVTGEAREAPRLRQDRFQGKNSVHQRDPLSEMDPAPSAGPQGTGETAP